MLDIRLMEYYLAVIREGNISAAAEALHISQPALSRQIRDLEEQLGVTLFERGSRRITLTEEGKILRRRAEEIIRLAGLTEQEISEARSRLSGDIFIGAGESHVFHYLSHTAGMISGRYPAIRFHLISGDTQDLLEQLSGGLLDCALIFTDFDRSVYESLRIPQEDSFGVLMRRDSALAEKEKISMSDLAGLPLLISRASAQDPERFYSYSGLNIIGTYNLIYNASLMVEDGVGYALCFDHLISTEGNSPLCFRPLDTQVRTNGHIIWKKYQSFSPAVQVFIDKLKESVEQN